MATDTVLWPKSCLVALSTFAQHALSLESIFWMGGKMIQKCEDTEYPKFPLVEAACRWKYIQTMVIDGNFVSQHLQMQNPFDDVSLSDGHSFMVTSGPYEDHIKVANDTREVMIYLILLPISILC